MLDTLNRLIDLSTVFWLFPICFMLHDFEEIVVVEGWLARHRDHIRTILPVKTLRLQQRLDSVTTLGFARAVLLIFILLSAVTFYAVQTLHSGGAGLLLFVGALNVLFLNSFTHLGQSLLVRGYTPGVLTAVIVLLPYTLYAYQRLFAEALLDWGAIGRSLPVTLGFLLLFGIAVSAGRTGTKKEER
ncbi:HXXEE domain-containing protein [Brevibacillus fluminis]|uniref:HXXEE domain-containing protein n=1 Tax=Brevibacillus fluminis TaxID=511487 RepID=UPI003F8CCFEC